MTVLSWPYDEAVMPAWQNCQGEVSIWRWSACR